MSRSILFDLDGTLLPMDTDSFLKAYLTELAEYVSHIIDPQKFTQALWAGTQGMIENVDTQKTNEKIFEETFLALTQLEKEQIWPTLDEFYEKIFPKLSYLCEPTPVARKVIETAISQKFQVAIATNPVFPKAAIYERLRWAGLSDLPFSHVSVYENSYFTKPHLQYYEQICQELGVSPKDCVMVGNDKQEDMVASLLGMGTYLVEGNIVDRGEPSYSIDNQGTLEDLYQQIQSGMFLKRIER